MRGIRTTGQPGALAAIEAMLGHGVPPHAILLAGPAGVGKTTLALDLAAALLCSDPDPQARPCRTCRTCRMVDTGNHPDLHRLAPSGPGAQIGIGGPDRARGVRDLITELVLMPIEGRSRVAIIEQAQRLNEDAQSALLKTLEEPPDGVTVVLCADDEERLLPTVRSRCARVRLGLVASREIERLLGELGLAEPPLAGRLARIGAGRPGVAVAYARADEAPVLRGEISRRLLDLRSASVSAGLIGIRELLARAGDLVRALEAGEAQGGIGGVTARRRGVSRGRGSQGSLRTPVESPLAAAAGTRPADARAADTPGSEHPGAAGGESPGSVEAPADPIGAGRIPAAERRRAALVLVGIWADVARDLALVAVGERERVRDPDLLEELEAAAPTVGAVRAAAATLGAAGAALPTPSDRATVGDGSAGGFLRRLAGAAELLEGNVAPELMLDVLALAWRKPIEASGPKGSKTGRHGVSATNQA